MSQFKTYYLQFGIEICSMLQAVKLLFAAYNYQTELTSYHIV